MESCIEYCYHWSVWHYRLASFDTHNVCWVVEWCQFAVSFADCQNFVVYQNAFCKVFGTVNYTVTNCRNFVHRFDNATFWANECIQNHFDCNFVVWHIVVEYSFFTVCFVSQNRSVDSNSFAQTFSDNAFVCHIDKLIFER